jgi:hypothetical protein
VSFRAAPGCPGEDAFLAEVTARTTRIRPAREGEEARTFSVVIDASEARYRVSLEIVGADGTVNRRDLDGSDCAELVSAVALVAALAVDPEASTTLVAGAGSASATTGSAEAVPSVSAAPAALAPPPPVFVPPPAVPEAASASERASFRWSVGAEADVVAGIVPFAAVGGGAYVDLAPERGPWVPSFRFTAFAATTRATFAPAVAADMTWALGRVAVCPMRPALSTSVGVEACPFFEAGTLVTAGSGVDEPSTTLRGWAALGALGRVRWTASARFELALEAGVDAPLLRYQLSYRSGNGETTRLTSTYPVGGTFAVGAGYRFP